MDVRMLHTHTSATLSTDIVLINDIHTLLFHIGIINVYYFTVTHYILTNR